MQNDRDHYAAYYSEKLWNLLPVVYRAQDTDSLDRAGPLRELIDRIGNQAAILRRSIDRLWEDQSIETCDDWLIPYIGELLATRLVASLGSREKRLDVAKTIYYRRRAGTVAILEEIAHDITGWESKVVEFFRRLSRTRHSLDPPLRFPDTLLSSNLPQAQGLTGQLNNTPVGGWADLRNIYGASKTHSAFDEFSYTVDSRRGIGQVGWHNIPKLGVFLWRLYSFGVGIPPNYGPQLQPSVGVTPVQYQGQPDRYTFDPTGREIPLFAANAASYGDRWVSPEEWQLPTQIDSQLLKANLSNLYAETLDTAIAYHSLGVFDRYGNLIPVTQIAASTIDWLDTSTRITFLGLWMRWYKKIQDTRPLDVEKLNRWRNSLEYYLLSSKDFLIDPERGKLLKASPAAENIFVTYHYGFSSTVGAGPFDRRTLPQQLTLPSDLLKPVVIGGQEKLTTPRGTPPKTPLGEVIPNGILTIADSRTYTTVSDLEAIEKVILRAENRTSPLIRPKPDAHGNITQWVFSAADRDDGNENKRELVLDGLFLSRVDVVLRGEFDTVILTNCTFDPGQSGNGVSPTTLFATAADGLSLSPCHIWVEGYVKRFEIIRCISGPIRTRNQGTIGHLAATDSIFQAIKTADLGFLNPKLFALRLKNSSDPLSEYLYANLNEATRQRLSAYEGMTSPSLELQQELLSDLNSILATPLYDEQRFERIQLNAVTRRFLARTGEGDDLMSLNRCLLKDAYPLEVEDTTITMTSGETVLTRCTLLGPASLHRLQASECILNDGVYVTDRQQGCIRFSAWATSSTLPVKRYESVEIAPRASLFTSRIFGQPGFAKLRSDVDSAIISGESGATISEGAQDGSEMGAFAGEKNPIKERSLRLKYEEYMPLGLTPVIVYAT